MKILAIGEVMMRLTPPEYRMLEQTDQVALDYTGSGLNLLASMSKFGAETALLTAVPENSVGEAARSAIRKYGQYHSFQALDLAYSQQFDFYKKHSRYDSSKSQLMVDTHNSFPRNKDQYVVLVG